MNVAITGSTGLIGQALCKRLTAGGHEVVRVVRGAIGSNEPTIRWNPATAVIDAKAFEGIDGVVHLAGENIGAKRWTDHQKQMVKQSRVKGTRLLAETLASLDRKPAVLISGSAVGYYGDRGDERLNETSTPGDLFLSDVVEAWEAAAQPAIDAGIRTAFIRTGVVLDKRGGALGKMLLLFRLGLGGRIGSGKQWMSWITLDDEVAAISWLLDHDISGPVNLVAPNSVTNAEFTEALGAALHRPTMLPVPLFGPRLLFGTELVHDLLLAGQRIEPAVLEASGFHFQSPTIDEAFARILG